MPGDTALVRRRWARENLDHLRRVLMLGRHEFLVDPADPLRDGVLLR